LYFWIEFAERNECLPAQLYRRKDINHDVRMGTVVGWGGGGRCAG
jgi:hypothetical protein